MTGTRRLDRAERLELGEEPGLRLADRQAPVEADLRVGRLAAPERDPELVGAMLAAFRDEGDLVARGEVEQRRDEGETDRPRPTRSPPSPRSWPGAARA